MTITISPKFQVVIPKTVRDTMKLSTGMKFEVIPYGDRIELIPIQNIKKSKGRGDGYYFTIYRS